MERQHKISTLYAQNTLTADSKDESSSLERRKVKCMSQLQTNVLTFNSYLWDVHMN